MRLDGKASAGHHLFLGAKNLAEGFNLRVHPVEQLFYGVDAEFTALVRLLMIPCAARIATSAVPAAANGSRSETNSHPRAA